MQYFNKSFLFFKSVSVRQSSNKDDFPDLFSITFLKEGLLRLYFLKGQQGGFGEAETADGASANSSWNPSQP